MDQRGKLHTASGGKLYEAKEGGTRLKLQTVLCDRNENLLTTHRGKVEQKKPGQNIQGKKKRGNEVWSKTSKDSPVQYS